ncbi:MAG: helix-turn-helix transcriptional regulator [Phycisphaerae bacterium]
MPYSDQQWNNAHVEMLMDIATTLADYTQSLEQCSKVPAYLSRVLDLEPITLAVVRQQGETEPKIVLLASSGQVATGEAGAAFHKNILEIHEQTRPLTARDGLMLRPAIAGKDHGFSELQVHHLATYPRALVAVRTIDEQHRMFLIVHQRADQIGLSARITDTLLMAARQLSKLLRCVVASISRPETLGGPFDRLTEREWVVLRGLNSDQGEKQLADQLNLSPHTLHSHIKSIYRKVGVQGRLPLLLRLNEAMRDLRTTTINMRSAQPMPEAIERAVAVG